MDPNNSNEKKITFEDLSKEELIKKCKSFLTIIQKAKQSKHILQEEIEKLKLEKKEELPLHVEELINDLTQQKLNYVSTIEDLKLKNESLVTNLNQYKEEKKRLENELNRLENENVALSRQATRLNDDNEQLLIHLETLEKQLEEMNKIGLEQRKQLLELEIRNDDVKQQEKIVELEKMLSISLEEIKRLKIEGDDGDKQEKLKEKVKSYHTKIVRLAMNVKELKDQKELILEQYKNYTVQVKDWKDKLNVAYQNFLDFIRNYETENEDLKKNNKRLEDLNARFLHQLEMHKTDDEKSKEIDEINNLKEKAERLKKNISENENFLKTLQEENGHMKIQIKALDDTIANTEEENTKKKEQEKVYLENIDKLEITVGNLKEELKKSLATEKQLAEKSGEEILKLVEEIDMLTEKNTKLQERSEEYEKMEKSRKQRLVNADIQTENEFVPSSVLQEEIVLLKNENCQLLTEMNEMNQELKERGENISKLEAHCDEIKRKIQIYETQANKNVNNITEKEETIKSLQNQINNQNDEITNLKNEIERCNSNYPESDILSTSTISRTEEMERLKDLEGSWEEKYGKLRGLALKLKAKLKEQTEILNASNILEKQHSVVVGDLEKAKLKCLELTETIEKMSHDLKFKDDELVKLKGVVDNMEKEKTNVEVWKKQIAIKVQALRKELDEKEAIKKDYEQKMSKLKADLEAKTDELKIEIENHRLTKNSLQHSTNENKKHNVLNLEMQDYEKSVKDLSVKLERKNEQVTKLKGQLDSQKSILTTLREQTGILEDKIRVYEIDLETSKNETNLYKKKLIDLEDNLEKKDEETTNLSRQVENLRTQNEELSTELSKDIAERQKIISSLKEEKETIYLQNLNLQQHTRELQEKLKLKTDEFNTINNEYENYKIRAQSVLRQNQNRDINLEEKLSGNVSNLTSQVEQLNLEINELKKLNEITQKENERHKTEETSLNLRNEQISKEIEQIKNQHDELLTKHNQTLKEHNETVRSLKIQHETLSQCYRQQLSEQEVRHNREIVELQSKIEKVPSTTDLIIPNLPTMTREEGEGSESIESINNSPVSLEKLLGGDEDNTINMKKQLNEQESKLSHLTELLADTEQDLAKHVQMNKVLKEEIRRQQRAVEREKHAENLEYLKNVMFKFITLNSCDERTRLVPVLNTILKLSPEEARKLDLVAKGDPGVKNWSSYLPTWTSPK